MSQKNYFNTINLVIKNGESLVDFNELFHLPKELSNGFINYFDDSFSLSF